LITAVDTNVLLDILIPDARHADRSQQALERALADGALVICEVVYAELASQFPEAELLDQFMKDTHIRLEPSSRRALLRATNAWTCYLADRGAHLNCPTCGAKQTVQCSGCGTLLSVRQHILSDFLIGGHALDRADRLLTRDRGFYRGYFVGLNLMVPG